MTDPHHPLNPDQAQSVPSTPEDAVRRMVEQAAHLLPAQGPIRVFVHHNTLHAFEDLPFEEAVVKAGERFGCRPFLDEEEYRSLWLEGRILTEDLRSVLLEDLGVSSSEAVAGSTTRLELRLALMAVGLQEPDEEELDWHTCLSKFGFLKVPTPSRPAAIPGGSWIPQQLQNY